MYFRYFPCTVTLWCKKITYRQQLVPDLRRQLWVRVCQLQSHWRRCWKSHHRLQWSCLRASDRQVGYRVPNSTTPSRHCPSGLRPVQRVHWYIPAEKRKIAAFERKAKFILLRTIRTEVLDHLIFGEGLHNDFRERNNSIFIFRRLLGRHICFAWLFTNYL